MKVFEAKKCFFDYHSVNSKPNTIRNYELLLPKFCDQFGHRDLESITSEEVLTFLTRFTEGTKQSTRRLRYSLLSACQLEDSDIHCFQLSSILSETQPIHNCRTLVTHLSSRSYSKTRNPITGRFWKRRWLMKSSLER